FTLNEAFQENQKGLKLSAEQLFFRAYHLKRQVARIHLLFGFALHSWLPIKKQQRPIRLPMVMGPLKPLLPSTVEEPLPGCHEEGQCLNQWKWQRLVPFA